MAEQNEMGYQALKQEIRKLESRVTELERSQKKDISIIKELIYLYNTNFLGSLTNKKIIADLKQEIIYPEDTCGAYPSEYQDYFSFKHRCEEIQCGDADAHIVQACYYLIKKYENIEEQIKRYTGDKEEE